MEKERYYALIMELIERYNHDEISKEIIDRIPKEDIQAARKWAYQKQINHNNQNSGLMDH